MAHALFGRGAKCSCGAREYTKVNGKWKQTPFFDVIQDTGFGRTGKTTVKMCRNCKNTVRSASGDTH